jgi:hypothetical protein
MLNSKSSKDSQPSVEETSNLGWPLICLACIGWLAIAAFACYTAAGIFSEGGNYLYAALANDCWSGWPVTEGLLGIDTRAMGRGLPLLLPYLASKLAAFSTLSLARLYTLGFYVAPIFTISIIKLLAHRHSARLVDLYFLSFVLFSLPIMMFSATEAFVSANVFWIALALLFSPQPNSVWQLLAFFTCVVALLLCHESGLLYLSLLAAGAYQFISRQSLLALRSWRSWRSLPVHSYMAGMACVIGVMIRLAKDAHAARLGLQPETSSYFALLHYGTNPAIKLSILVLATLMILSIQQCFRKIPIIIPYLFAVVVVAYFIKAMTHSPDVDRAVAARPYIMLGTILFGALAIVPFPRRQSSRMLRTLSNVLVCMVVITQLCGLFTMIKQWNDFRSTLTEVISQCKGVHKTTEFAALQGRWAGYYNLRYAPVSALLQGPSVKCLVGWNRERPSDPIPEDLMAFRPGNDFGPLRDAKYFRFQFVD